MATAADIITSVRAATGQVYADGSGPITDAQILLWANELYPLVRRKIAKFAGDLFATNSTAFTVAAGATEIDVSSLTTLDIIFEVKKLYGTVYRTVDEAGPDPEGSGKLVWRRRGMAGSGVVIELYPARVAPGTYKLRYMATATALTGSGAVLLPAGAERILIESVASRVMQRLERDWQFHDRAAAVALDELQSQLGPSLYVIADVTGRY